MYASFRRKKNFIINDYNWTCEKCNTSSHCSSIRCIKCSNDEPCDWQCPQCKYKIWKGEKYCGDCGIDKNGGKPELITKA